MDATPVPTPTDQIPIIVSLFRWLGFRPFDIVQSDSRHFRQRTSAFGLAMYAANGLFVIVCLCCYYDAIMIVATYAKNNVLGELQSRIVNNVMLGVYFVVFVGLLFGRSMQQQIVEVTNELELRFSELEWKRPVVTCRWSVKIFLIVFCFARLFVYIYCLYFHKFTFEIMFASYGMIVVPHMATIVCVFSFMCFVLTVKVYLDMLNEVLEEVRKTEQLIN